MHLPVRSLIAAIALLCSSADAAELLVAVSANFVAPLQKIVAAFEADTIHRVKMSVGSTGAFYTQIRSGAPFDMLIAADEQTPERIDAEGLAVPRTRFTYATGRLVLWSPNADLVDEKGAVLLRGDFARIAIGNPRLAPYGKAAAESLEHMGLYATLQPKIVQGENIGQAFQFVQTGNAQLGFIALSQVMVDGKIAKGSAWIVPQQMYAPLKQDAVILKHAAANPAATAFAKYLKGEKARGIIRAYGYELQ
jgi:molybdate transport system substrate-binding protein